MKNRIRASLISAAVGGAFLTLAGSMATAEAAVQGAAPLAAPQSQEAPLLLARRGADDAAGDTRRGRGKDDPAGDDRRARTLKNGADDPAGHTRRGRGTDDPAGDDKRRGRGTDDPAGHQRRGRGSDDRAVI